MDIQTVRSVASLSRLQLSEDDIVRMNTQLSAILAYIDQLAELDTENVEPLAHPLPMQNVFRDDIPGPSLSPDEALANAPLRSGNFFAVPAILDDGQGS